MPGSTARSDAKLRISRPAPTSSTTASAIFSDDERLAEPAMADAGADLTRTILQRFLHVGAGAFERRREAADDRRRERHRRGEGQDRITEAQRGRAAPGPPG